jgi:hypothetical protein
MQIKYNYQLQGITINPSSKTIVGLQKSAGALTIIANYTDGTQNDITDYISKNAVIPLTYTPMSPPGPSTIAYVENGVLKSGSRIGNQTITAEYNGKSGTCAVTVTEDMAPPKVVKADPANGQTGVTYDATSTFSINLYFDDNIQWAPNGSKITLKSSAKTYFVNVFAIANNLRISTSEAIEPTTQYTLIVPRTSVKDLAGNYLASDYQISFTTAGTAADTTPPKLISSNPAGGQKLLVKGIQTVNLAFTFSENVQLGHRQNEIKVIDQSNGQNVMRGTPSINGKVLTITADLNTDKTYTVVIPGPNASNPDGAICDRSPNKNPFAGIF